MKVDDWEQQQETMKWACFWLMPLQTVQIISEPNNADQIKKDTRVGGKIGESGQTLRSRCSYIWLL